MNDIITLIPVSCKLCGGNVEINYWEDDTLQIEQWMCHIQCLECHTPIPPNRPYSSSKQMAKQAAIQLWNNLHKNDS